MADNEDRVGFVFQFILKMASEKHAVSRHAGTEGQNDSATVVEENDLGLPTIYSHPDWL